MWNERYNEAGFAYGEVPNDFLREHFGKIPKGGKVLCLAEGEGRNAVFLAEQGYQVTAVDQSAVGLGKARDLAVKRGVEITTLVADLGDFSLGENRWDGIVSIAAHVPPALRKTLHGQVADSLKPGGVMLLEAFTPRQLEMEGRGGPPVKEMMMSLEELTVELAALDFHVGREIERHLSEGPYHEGRCALVQVIAKKGGRV